MKKKLPNNWVKVPLQDIVEILDNKRKPISAKERAKRLGDVPYYGATGIAGFINNHIFDEELVLLGEDGAPFFDKRKNVAYLIKGKSWVNNHAHVLRAKEGITCNKFILFFLNMFDYTDFVGGTTRLKLTQGDLRKIPISLPPRPEQDRIVAKLDRLFEQLDTINESLQKIPVLLKNFRQQVLTQAVTGKLTEEWREGKGLEVWRTELANECCRKVQSGGTPKGSNFSTSGIPFFKVYNIVDQQISFDYKPQFITKEIQYSQGKKSICYPNDVLMNIVGPPLNKVAIIPEDFKECNINQAITVFRPKDYLKNKFLYYFLREGTPVNSLINETRGVVGQVNISLTQCREFKIPIPSLREQEEIVNRVENLFQKADAIEQQYLSLKEKIKELPQAILHKAFKGELVPELISDGNARELLREIEKSKVNLILSASDRRKKMTDFNERVRKYNDNEEDLNKAAEGASYYKNKI